MNIEDYISSGILEAYVAGQLSDSERVEVERMAATYPKVKEEITAIENAQETFLMKTAVAPPAHVREKVLSKIAESPRKVGKVIDLDRGLGLPFWRFAAAASISVAIIASFLAYNYWNKWRRTDQVLASLITSSRSMAENYNQVNRRLDKLESDLIIIDNPDFTKVVMTGTPNAPEAVASVYWNKSSKEVFLRIQNLKELTAENQYQLWAIIDGKPVDAGVFDGTEDGLIKMKDIQSGAVTFAVTIEPHGGKPSPSLETMQVAGNVSKS